MNHLAVEIAIANADSAIDQCHNYTDSIAAYAQNVRDTLVEQGLDAFRREALYRYYYRVAELIESGADIDTHIPDTGSTTYSGENLPG